MKIKSFSPCSDWYFTFAGSHGQINYQLAGWAVAEGSDGGADQIIGMVAASGGGPSDKVMGNTCRLVTVPPVHGTYKHVSELAPIQQHT